MGNRRMLALATALTLVALAAAPAQVAPAAAAPAYDLPPANGTFDYQLGGAYTPAAGVEVVSRDRLAEPAPGVYNVCYVNFFQTQPDERGQSKTRPPHGTTAWWKKWHPTLLLRDSKKKLVVDKDWNEALFDTRTAAKRAALFKIQRAWITGCATAGFDAVEPDNLDVHVRSKKLLTASKTAAYLKLVIPFTHAAGLAIAQKNASDQFGSTGPALGFDFAIAEECERYRECGAYSAYGDLLFEIEYTDENPRVTRGGVTKTVFEWACAERAERHSIILRDRDLRSAGSSGYVYESC